MGCGLGLNGCHTSSGMRWIVLCCLVVIHLLSATSDSAAVAPAASGRRTPETRRRHVERSPDSTSSVATSTTVTGRSDEDDLVDDCTTSLTSLTSIDYSGNGNGGGGSGDDSSAEATGEGNNGDENSLERCLGRGREFLNMFLKSIRKQHLQFDKCSQYRQTVTCLRLHLRAVRPCRSGRASRQLHHQPQQPELHASSAAAATTNRRHVLRSSSSNTPVNQTVQLTGAGRRRTARQTDMADLTDWIPIINQLDRVCAPTTNRSKYDISRQRCVEEELRGALSHRCDEMHKFNVEQRTRHDCHFLRERIHCKEALVSSACGAEAGNFAFSVVKLATEKQSARHGCKITLEKSYSAFRYGNGCPRDFLQQVDSCTSRHLTEKNVAKFHTDNDLIALGSDRSLRHTCRVFKRFSQCITPIKTQCDLGFTQLLDYEGDLRRYILKMNHICDDSVIDVYAGSLTCYQNIMEAGTLGQCDTYWADLSPWLSNITSYQFYCEPTNINTVNLLGELQKLHMCHANVLTRGCGVDAARVMSDLVHDALHDPLYLRLGHRADCGLHRSPLSELAPSHLVPTHRMTVEDTESGLRPTLAAVFTVDEGSVEGTEPETRDKSASVGRSEDSIDEETAYVQPEVAGDRRQDEENNGFDSTGYRDREDDVDDDDSVHSPDSKSAMLNGARRRSSVSAASIRQASLLSSALANFVAFVSLTALLARRRY